MAHAAAASGLGALREDLESLVLCCRRAWAAVGVVGLAAAGCGGPSVRGAQPVSPGREPRGPELAAYRVGKCSDRAREPVDLGRQLRVVVLSGPSGPVVVEKRIGADSLVITNVHDEADTYVAQAVTDGGSGKVLRQITVPRLAASANRAPARLDLGTDWTETDLGNGRFRARLSKPALSCALEPVVLPAS